MKIKNIQQYRSFYKTTRPVSQDLEEHFIGNYYIDTEKDIKKFGWFTMYHGDRDGFSKPEAGIENFLQSFLDMAKDGQAVYEFLQNAVDAGSTHYTMIWGQDPVDNNHYLLVANNGEMFTPNSIRSILNVGSSTKNADSQTIGKFGIGFKLAHRLVGKDNGLQELVNENSGPLLFSWKNYDLQYLASGSAPIPSEVELSNDKRGEITVNDENPWLFKILITCFPCLPENDLVLDLPKMANGIKATSNPFSKEEYEVLARWVQNNKGILNEQTYNNGALFFIKLGSGKESELAEINLKEGVKFALAILKETADSEERKDKVLHTVQLNNDEPITYPDLEYIKLSVDKIYEKDTYAHIRFGVDYFEELTLEQRRKIEEEANIETLFGFRKYHEIGDYFKGAPNLYLYFPLSEEVHNFNYILHCNAFYKGSSRTFLHKGSSKEDGINERLLKIIVTKIDQKLMFLANSDQSEDRQLFLHFYAALLTSTKSLNQDRLWIEEPYINRVNELLQKYIPVRKDANTLDFKITDKAETVFIKKTNVEIDSDAWGMENVSWFYWSDDSYKVLQDNAREKLEINDFTVYDLLSNNESISNSLNAWINNEEEKIKGILFEISSLETEIVKEPVFKENLFKIPLLKFNNGEVLSITSFMEKEKEGYFIIYNKLADISDLLQKLGLVCTAENFDSYNFNPKYFNLFANDSHVRSYTTLTKLFSEIVKDEKLKALNTSEKRRIFEAFRTLNDNPGERMGELKLLNNNFNNPVRFKNLYSFSSSAWLNKFCINGTEESSYCKNYLLDKQDEVYQNIVYPFWDQLVGYIAGKDDQAKEILDDIVKIYEKSSSPEKHKLLLSTSKLTIYKSEVITAAKLFFNQELTIIDEDKFDRLQNIAYNYFGINIPDRYLIPHLDKEPFLFASATIDPKIDAIQCTSDQINDLLQFSIIANLDFFEVNTVALKDGVYYIDSTLTKKQIATNKSAILNYIKTYYPDDYEPLPDSLKSYRGEVALADSMLIKHLIECFDEKNMEQELDLIELVLSESHDDKKLLLDKLTFTILDSSWEQERQNELYIKLLKEIFDTDISTVEVTAIHKKIVINKAGQEINIGDIDSAHDSIKVLRGDKEIILSQSQILSLENADNIKLIQEFNDEAKKRELINKSAADKLFKISNAGITDELINKFKANLDEGHLTNIHQLLFVLLSGRINKEDFKNYSLQGYNDEWYTLEKQLIIYTEENVSYIAPQYLLNACYEGLQSLFQLSDIETYNYNEEREDNIIASRYLFVKGCNPEILSGSTEIATKLDYLYKGWINLPFSIKDYKRNHNWKEYLDIVPNQYILNGIHTVNEILPSTFLAWSNNDRRKEDFIKAFGVYVNDSPIEKLRSFLIDKSGEPTDIELTKFNEILLLNTIKGLSGEFIVLNDQTFIYEEPQHNAQLRIIEQIINHLDLQGSQDYPVLVYHSNSSFKMLLVENVPIHIIDEGLHLKLIADSNNNLSLLYKSHHILRQSLILEDRVVEKYDKVSFDKTFVPSGYESEHNEPFYYSWKSENGISLYKENELKFDFSLEIAGEYCSIGLVSDGIFYVGGNEGAQEIFYNKSVSLEDLSIALSEEYNELAIAIDNLIEKRNIMLTSIYNALNAAGKSEVKSAHLQALEAAFKEENLKQERKSLIDDIKGNSQYSYTWFESYLKFLLTFENKQDTTTQKTISFQEIKRYVVNEEVSNKYFLLCGASSLIPLNIEDFDDFKITLIIKNRQNENIKVEGVSKRGQDLLIFCREAIPQSIISKFIDVIQIKISFSPVIDLLERLHRAFINKGNIAEWDDIKDALPSLQFIYGPTGTGKTTTLCSMIVDVIKEKHDTKYLLMTPTNKAADVLCKKLLKPSNATHDIVHQKLKDLEGAGKYIGVTRVGKPTDPELEELNNEIYQDSLNLHDLGYTNVVASTIHRIPYFEVIDEDNATNIKLFKLENHWDYVVFDEASMINLPYLVFSIIAIRKFSPNAKFIIAGDPKQIPPVVDVNDKDLEELDIQDENVYRMMGISSFNCVEQILRECDTINNLSIQYRSVKQIGQLFSDLSYSDLLKHDRHERNDDAKPLPEAFKKIIGSNVTFIDIPLNYDNSIYRVNKLLYSPYHTYSAIFVAEIIKHFDSLLKDGENWTIGLIAPYKAQAILLNKLITSYGISDKLKVYSDTVHGFQGDECDIVFFISNPNNYYYTGHPKSLLSKEYIYNVAISRARDYLVILHPFEAIQNNTYINSIMSSYSKNFGNLNLVKSTDIEMKIFHRKDYIEKNSYITGHDNVNVFGQIEMKYFIKANENAIDIQLRKI
ncbi:AAA domain-containing protein [Pedobacter agri]|uniref:AAA domain-containing protein n=1 Tax=Pedobacter agri TaxID=454586 RepID=UPI0029316E9F|nr:AAA domain-containing protein [Pedobacter agri]